MQPVMIGPLTLSSPVLLAPMAGYTDLPFRMTMRKLGGLGLAYTEMLDPKSILRGGGQKRTAILATSPEDRPLGWQLYGTDAALLADAARWLADRGAALIDINMGCPQKKISRRGSGAGLLKTPREAVRLAAQIVKAVSIPVTAKLRSGWETRATAAEMAAALETAGIAAITIHGRTGLQKYSGQADWTAIRDVVRQVRSIPVIGNGDVATPAMARAMLAETGCAGIMVGRAALGNPWIIREIHAALTGQPCAQPTRRERWDFMRRHFEELLAFQGARIGTLAFRRWLPQYARELQIEKKTMIAWLQLRQPDELRQRLRERAEDS